MSQIGQAATPSTWQTVADDVNKIFGAVQPYLPAVEAVAGATVPGAALAIDIADKVLQGYLALEPTAVELVTQMQSGTPVTANQLIQYQNERAAAYLEAKAAIAAALAKLPAGS
jgi:hypothetical protein